MYELKIYSEFTEKDNKLFYLEQTYEKNSSFSKQKSINPMLDDKKDNIISIIKNVISKIKRIPIIRKVLQLLPKGRGPGAQAPITPVIPTSQ